MAETRNAGARVVPSNQVNIGVIGAKGMGWSDARSHLCIPGVNVVGIADVDRSVLAERSRELESTRRKAPQNFDDYRRILERQDIDAVIVGTPDHGYCLAMTDGVGAGKHVFVINPFANTIEKCRVMRAPARRSVKVVQVGRWQRSSTNYASAIAYVRTGKLGRIRAVKVWAYQGWMKPVPVQPDGGAPDGVNYDMWLGGRSTRTASTAISAGSGMMAAD